VVHAGNGRRGAGSTIERVSVLVLGFNSMCTVDTSHSLGLGLEFRHVQDGVDVRPRKRVYLLSTMRDTADSCEMTVKPQSQSW
jgi:hypothetical protein